MKKQIDDFIIGKLLIPALAKAVASAFPEIENATKSFTELGTAMHESMLQIEKNEEETRKIFNELGD